MGFDHGILIDSNTPIWDYQEGYETYLTVWKQSHTPRSWILNSCVWYSGHLIEKLGIEKINNYIQQFQYGNQDTAGINRQDWPGALMISAQEQILFLQKLLDQKLGVSTSSYEKTKHILYQQDLIGNWKLYGKTGVGEGPNGKRVGWFIGWIEKANRQIVFASHVVYDKKPEGIPSLQAKDEALYPLLNLIHHQIESPAIMAHGK